MAVKWVEPKHMLIRKCVRSIVTSNLQYKFHIIMVPRDQ